MKSIIVIILITNLIILTLAFLLNSTTLKTESGSKLKNKLNDKQLSKSVE
jgi:hypothetical protein